MHHELKTKIYEAVEVATEEGKQLTEADLAISLGEATVSQSNQARLSVAFINSMDTMTGKRWLKLETTSASKRSRSKRVVALGPEPMPELGPDDRVLAGPPLTVYRDESVIDRGRPWASRKHREKTEELVEIVPIEIPASLQPQAPGPAPAIVPVLTAVAVPAAAKAIAQPVATTCVRSESVVVDDRINTAWNELISRGAPFARSNVCDMANVSRSLRKRDRLANTMATAIGLMAAEGWDRGAMERYLDLPSNVESFVSEFSRHAFTAAKAVSRPEPTISVPPKSYEGLPRDRAIAAWHDLIDGDETFSRSQFCALANLSTGGQGKWKALNEKVSGAIWVMARNGWPQEMRQKYRDLVEAFLSEWDVSTAKAANPIQVEEQAKAAAEVEQTVADEVEAVEPVEKTETPVADIAPAHAVEEPLNVVEALQQQVDKMGQEIALAMQQIEHHNQEIVQLSQWAAELAEKKSVLMGAIEVLS